MAMTAQELVAEAKKQIHETDVAGARELVSRAPVVDVREPGEFAAGSLPGAVNIPRGVLEFQIGSHPALRGVSADADILVYCQSGGRSALAAEALQKLGYAKPVSLAGGFKAWQDAGEKVVIPG